MKITFTETQKNRLNELGADEKIINQAFDDKTTQASAYQKFENIAVKKNKMALKNLLENKHKSELCQLQEDLANRLCQEGFTQVTTPILISAKALEKMTIDQGSALYEQVFWLNKKTCMRPMLAPNLYEVSQKIMNSQKTPLRIFEIGSCFRKESEGKSHLKEFTMLNLVEWGLPEEERLEHLKMFGALMMATAGIQDYQFEEETSVVYGEGLDIVSHAGLELASTSMGPHPLDPAWKINCTWVGIGIGLERLLMHREKQTGIHRYSKSNVFLDGICLKMK